MSGRPKLDTSLRLGVVVVQGHWSLTPTKYKYTPSCPHPRDLTIIFVCRRLCWWLARTCPLEDGPMPGFSWRAEAFPRPGHGMICSQAGAPLQLPSESTTGFKKLPIKKSHVYILLHY